VPFGRVLMVQGTSSHAGKSTFVAALCRILRQDGLRVAPFKAQNMSNNAAVTADGGEIGRAQAMQAEAAGIAPTVDMNPILLKPQGERTAQLVVLGHVRCVASVSDYVRLKLALWPEVVGALDRLRAAHDVVVIEGAGSPAEINLKAHDIVNMRVALHARAPVVLVGDIDRGGVFASLVGTMELLEPEERALVVAYVINKFRGDPSLLVSGLEFLEARTGVPTAGVLPYLTDVRLPEEDSLGLPRALPDGAPAVLDVAVVRFPRVANFDDLDPLQREPGVRVRWVDAPEQLDGADLVVLPGSKTTRLDLEWLRERGIAERVVAQRRAGVPVLGICGGFQMLGRAVRDPDGVEGAAGETPGLNLLPVVTTFVSEKATRRVQGTVAITTVGLLARCAGAAVEGYEIHMGRTVADPGAAVHVTLRLAEHADGATDAEGRTVGTYLHGLLHNDGVRRGVLAQLAAWKGVSLPPSHAWSADAEYDKLADHVRAHVDLPMLWRAAGLGPSALAGLVR
jgi:adenosylcobyric acid synthase